MDMRDVKYVNAHLRARGLRSGISKKLILTSKVR